MTCGIPFNTYMRKAGTHDTVTMDITGHSTREMFDRYNTVMELYLLGSGPKKATKE